MKSKTKQRIFVAVGLVVVAGILVGVKAGQIVNMVRAGESFVPPPLAVSSARVQGAEWDATRAAVGTLVAVQAVALGAEVPGRVRDISFESGASVKRGDVLVRLDTSAEEAQLASAVADAEFARATLERTSKLRRSEANAEADLDAAQAHAKQAEAAVANLRAIIAKKTIHAPFDGRVAMRQVNLGQIPLARDAHRLAPGGEPDLRGLLAPAAGPAGPEVRPAGAAAHRHFPRTRSGRGQVTAVNPEVDPDVARRPGPRRPSPTTTGRTAPAGMFERGRSLLRAQRAVLTIPVTDGRRSTRPTGDSVFAIDAADGGPRGRRRRSPRPGRSSSGWERSAVTWWRWSPGSGRARPSWAAAVSSCGTAPRWR